MIPQTLGPDSPGFTVHLSSGSTPQEFSKQRLPVAPPLAAQPGTTFPRGLCAGALPWKQGRCAKGSCGGGSTLALQLAGMFGLLVLLFFLFLLFVAAPQIRSVQMYIAFYCEVFSGGHEFSLKLCFAKENFPEGPQDGRDPRSAVCK